MSILVTGGAGFIGSHITDALLERGRDVWIVDDMSTGKEENIAGKARFVEMDISEAGLADLFGSAGPEVVFHCAAQIDVRKSLTDPLRDAKSNVLGTINLLEACRKWKTRKVIFSSSGGTIYGNADTAATEDFPVRPVSPYAVSKLSSEYYLECYRQWHQLDYTVLRYANVFGPRQNPAGEAGVVAIFSDCLLRGRRPVLYGFGNMIRDYLYVSDAVRANLAAMERGSGQILNIGTGRPTTVRELFDAIASILGYDGEPTLEPARKGELESIFLSCAKAREVLGWEPEVSLEEGLKMTTSWYGERVR
jgi:UDP-glucose 4-epimerase